MTCPDILSSTRGRSRPKIYLIERNSEAAVELARIDMPEALRKAYLSRIARRKGVYAIDEEVRAWLEEKLYGQESKGYVN